MAGPGFTVGGGANLVKRGNQLPMWPYFGKKNVFQNERIGTLSWGGGSERPLDPPLDVAMIPSGSGKIILRKVKLFSEIWRYKKYAEQENGKRQQNRLDNCGIIYSCVAANLR